MGSIAGRRAGPVAVARVSGWRRGPRGPAWLRGWRRGGVVLGCYRLAVRDFGRVRKFSNDFRWFRRGHAIARNLQSRARAPRMPPNPRNEVGGRIWTTTKNRSKCLGFAKIRSKSALLPVGWSADAHENPPNLPGWTRITSENSFPAHRKSSRIPEKFVFPMVVHAARCTEIAHFATNSWEASPSRRRNDQNHAAAIGVNRVFFAEVKFWWWSKSGTPLRSFIPQKIK